jgi:hypothetical protein
MEPVQTNISAKQLWEPSHILHATFIAWMEKRGINPANLGDKPRKQKASAFLHLMHVRRAA